MNVFSIFFNGSVLVGAGGAAFGGWYGMFGPLISAIHMKIAGCRKG